MQDYYMKKIFQYEIRVEKKDSRHWFAYILENGNVIFSKTCPGFFNGLDWCLTQLAELTTGLPKYQCSKGTPGSSLF